MSRMCTVTTKLLPALVLASVLAACTVSPPASQESFPPVLFSAGGQYVVENPALKPDSAAFFAANGKPVDLDRFEGKVVLLNFWAAWCAACGCEIPSLDALARETNGSDLAIVPVSVDKGGLRVARAFYKDHDVSHLPLFSDENLISAYFPPDNPNSAPFMLNGLPKTFLMDRKGRVRGYVIGEVDWTSTAARTFLDYYLNGPGRTNP